MRDLRHERIQRELFLAAFGANVMRIDPGVTDRLTAILEEQVAHPGETLFSAGEAPDFYYLLREGRVQLARAGSAPWTCQGPSVFGLSDALLERPRLRTAVALTEVQAMRVQSEAWIELLEDSFALARAAVIGSIRTVAALEERLWASRGGAPLPPNPTMPCAPGCELDVIERLAILTEAPLLRGAGVMILNDLASASEIVAFEAGQTLIERGKGEGRVHLLLEGEVQATRSAPGVVWRGGPGDVVCGTAAFGDPLLAWEAVARSAGRALTFRTADWLDVMEENFDMVRTTLGALSLDREELLERLS
jgi:CRP-like cAMP-binding protein